MDALCKSGVHFRYEEKKDQGFLTFFCLLSKVFEDLVNMTFLCLVFF